MMQIYHQIILIHSLQLSASVKQVVVEHSELLNAALYLKSFQAEKYVQYFLLFLLPFSNTNYHIVKTC